DLGRGALVHLQALVDEGVDLGVPLALGDDQVVAALGAEHQGDRALGRHLLLEGVDAVLDRLALRIGGLGRDEGVDALDHARVLEQLADPVAEGALGDRDGDLLAVAVAREVLGAAETILVELPAEIAHADHAAAEDQRHHEAGAAAALLLLLAAPAPALAPPRVVRFVIVIVVAAGEEGVLALVGSRVPVGAPLRLGFRFRFRFGPGAAAARGLGRRVRLGGAVVVGLLGGVRPGLLPVGVGAGRVRVLRVRAGLPAAAVVLLLVLLVLLGGVRPAVLVVLLLVVRVLLVVLLLLLVVLLLVVGAAVLVVLLRVLLLPAVVTLLGRPPFAVLLLRLRLLRVLLLAAVGLRALGGLLSTPSAVPVQRVVRMPRFGALAPAILSHRSPRAARWRSRGSSPASAPPLSVRWLFEHRRIARNVTVSRSDDHFDALSGCCT